MIEVEQIENWFAYHGATEEQHIKYAKLRYEAKAFAYLLCELVPSCADQTTAVRKLRECVMTANAAIACGGK